MKCRCGKKAVQFAHCTECWLTFVNYMYYVKHRDSDLWNGRAHVEQPLIKPQ